MREHRVRSIEERIIGKKRDTVMREAWRKRVRESKKSTI